MTATLQPSPTEVETRREIKADVEFLFDLVEKITDGRLRVPDFQRAYVWGRQDMLDLLDSVRRQYPFGSLFLWRTSQHHRFRTTLGPLALPEPPPQDLTLILDGQQRLTTLAALLVHPTRHGAADEEDPGRWSVVFDVAMEGGAGFAHVDPGAQLEPTQVPLHALRDTFEVLRACEAIAKTGRSDARELIKQVEDLARAFARCKVPLSLFISDDLTAAVDIYARLNKKGRRISADEMVSALISTQGEDFDLAARISETLDMLIAHGFGAVERTVPLRVLLTLAGRDIYKTDWTSLADDLRENVAKLRDAEHQSREGLERALTFLGQLGVPNVRFLPYGMQLVALAAFFARHPDPSPSQREWLRRWFWSTAFAAWFGLGNPARVRREVEAIRDGLGDDPASPTPGVYDLTTRALSMPSRFDLRAARVRASLCVLLALKPLGPDGQPLRAADRLLRDGPPAMVPLCATVADRDLRVSLANRIFALDNRPGQARDTLLELDPEVRERVLRSHAIRPETLPLLESRDHDAFLQTRLEEMVRLEREFMARESVELPPAETLTAAAPVETDD